MRKILGNYSSFKTYEWHFDESNGGRVLFEYFPGSLLAIISNALIIFISIFSLRKTNHFKYFVANTAFLGMCYASAALANGIIMTTWYVHHWTLSVIQCTALNAAMYCFAIANMCSYAPTITCRYTEIVKSRHCSKTQVVLQFLFPYSIILSFLIVYGFLANKVTHHKSYCIVLYCTKFPFPEVLIPVSSFQHWNIFTVMYLE